MKGFAVFAFVVLLVASTLTIPASASDSRIRIEILVPAKRAPLRTPYITGNIPALCNWEARCLPAQYAGLRGSSAVYVAELQVPATVQRLEFKSTLGTWRSEAFGVQKRPLENFVWQKGSSPWQLTVRVDGFFDNTPPSNVVGRLDHYDYFVSKHSLKARTVSVWRPSAAPDRSVACYRTLFAHDGENLFTESTSNYSQEWRMDEALEDLINAGHIAPTLVIATDSTKDRAKEYHYAFQGELFAKFLIEEVYPFVAARYPLCAGRNNTYVIGSSRGGLSSFALIYRHPEFFSRAAALSMHLSAKPDFRTIFDELPKPSLSVSFYMDHGDQGLDAEYPPHADRFRERFQAELPTSRIQYWNHPGTGHTESDWALRLPAILQFLDSGN